jgi:hypothetical protein
MASSSDILPSMRVFLNSVTDLATLAAAWGEKKLSMIPLIIEGILSETTSSKAPISSGLSKLLCSLGICFTVTIYGVVRGNRGSG